MTNQISEIVRNESTVYILDPSHPGNKELPGVLPILLSSIPFFLFAGEFYISVEMSSQQDG